MIKRNMLKIGIKLSLINRGKTMFFRKLSVTSKKVFKTRRKGRCLRSKVLILYLTKIHTI